MLGGGKEGDWLPAFPIASYRQQVKSAFSWLSN